jgi:ribonuclease-3
MPINKLESLLSHTFTNKDLLAEALRHPSLRQQDHKMQDYERLEFLGESILNFIITEEIFSRFKNYDEGKLAKMRAYLVCKDTICEVAEHLHLEDAIVMTKGEELSGGRNNPNNVENAMEAIIAAMYLDQGIEAAKKAVLSLWKEWLKLAPNIDSDPKSTLQELSQSMDMSIPHYEIVSRTGQPHAPTFEVMVKVGDLKGEVASGKSIKAAEKIAATKLLTRLKELGK